MSRSWTSSPSWITSDLIHIKWMVSKRRIWMIEIPITPWFIMHILLHSLYTLKWNVYFKIWNPILVRSFFFPFRVQSNINGWLIKKLLVFVLNKLNIRWYYIYTCITKYLLKYQQPTLFSYFKEEILIDRDIFLLYIFTLKVRTKKVLHVTLSFYLTQCSWVLRVRLCIMVLFFNTHLFHFLHFTSSSLSSI
jgi:hypothetical protein